jgi:hypothetical protein
MENLFEALVVEGFVLFADIRRDGLASLPPA